MHFKVKLSVYLQRFLVNVSLFTLRTAKFAVCLLAHFAARNKLMLHLHG